MITISDGTMPEHSHREGWFDRVLGHDGNQHNTSISTH